MTHAEIQCGLKQNITTIILGDQSRCRANS
jgi:hypothetical protein